MARTSLTKTTPPGGYSGIGKKLILEAADTSNNNKFPAQGKDLLVAKNTDSSSHTITVTSVDDRYGRRKILVLFQYRQEKHIYLGRSLYMDGNKMMVQYI